MHAPSPPTFQLAPTPMMHLQVLICSALASSYYVPIAEGANILSFIQICPFLEAVRNVVVVELVATNIPYATNSNPPTLFTIQCLSSVFK